jgi:ABC-type Na+ transport system ATPase subunit NatA
MQFKVEIMHAILHAILIYINGEITAGFDVQKICSKTLKDTLIIIY